MEHHDDELWIAACAHRLQQHWRSVDPLELEATARELAHDADLRQLAPAAAAARWLAPVESARGS
ncbi:MAG: hypothetical protein ACLGID_09100 [Gammaproteobacteria bacterium]|uniref:hypothetical protein n=1 Tax=Pseudacidovorax TaxID=433923 RepID=UPI000E0AC48A|nr:MULTISPECIES: hypothetical protein [Pseudacidovorax]MBP6895660.1 hypothetical protein [Pseudacidovorax sp.]